MKKERTGVDDLLDELKRIPEEVESKILIDDMAEALIDKLRRKISL